MAVTLPMYGPRAKPYLRIEVFSKSRCVDYERVKSNESVDRAAARISGRLVKERVI